MIVEGLSQSCVNVVAVVSCRVLALLRASDANEAESVDGRTLAESLTSQIPARPKSEGFITSIEHDHGHVELRDRNLNKACADLNA